MGRHYERQHDTIRPDLAPHMLTSQEYPRQPEQHQATAFTPQRLHHLRVWGFNGQIGRMASLSPRTIARRAAHYEKSCRSLLRAHPVHPCTSTGSPCTPRNTVRRNLRPRRRPRGIPDVCVSAANRAVGAACSLSSYAPSCWASCRAAGTGSPRPSPSSPDRPGTSGESRTSARCGRRAAGPGGGRRRGWRRRGARCSQRPLR
jgi:hypothetical protein